MFARESSEIKALRGVGGVSRRRTAYRDLRETTWGIRQDDETIILLYNP